MSRFFKKGFVFKTRCLCLNVKFNQQLNNKLNKPSGDYTASRAPKVLPLCYGVDLNEWNLIKKQIIRFPQNLSSFVHQPLPENHQGIRSGHPEPWDTLENSWFQLSAQIPEPPLPADGKSCWWSPEGLWGAPGAAQEAPGAGGNTIPALKGNWGGASGLPAAGEFQHCHSAAPERAGSQQRAARVSPGSEGFVFLLPRMNLS